jgi:acyl carrier protein
MDQTSDCAPLSRQDLEDWLSGRISTLSGIPVEEIDLTLPIADFDLDSSVVVSLTQALSDRLCVDLPVTTLWEHPNIESLAAALAPGDVPESERV